MTRWGEPGYWIKPIYRTFNFSCSSQKVYCSKCRKEIKDYHKGMMTCPHCGDAKIDMDEPMETEVLFL